MSRLSIEQASRLRFETRRLYYDAMRGETDVNGAFFIYKASLELGVADHMLEIRRIVTLEPHAEDAFIRCAAEIAAALEKAKAATTEADRARVRAEFASTFAKAASES